MTNGRWRAGRTLALLFGLGVGACAAISGAPPNHRNFAAGVAAAASLLETPRPGEQRGLRFEGTVTRSLEVQYLLFLPGEYGSDDRRWPLIVYLHGGSLRGAEIDAVRIWGVPRVAERDPAFPFMVLSPQAPAGTLWTDGELLIRLIDEITEQYAVDPDRIYLTGHSIGGNGTWYLAYLHPERFAAIAPMSAPANPWWATRLKDVPVWAFHGEADEIVPLRESESMVAALRSQGADVEFTVLTGRGHGILDVYEDRALYDWFLQHRRR